MVDGDDTQAALFQQSHATVDSDDFDLDGVFEVLSHFRRRSVLYAFTMDDQWTLSALATTLAAWEHAVDEEAVDEHMHERMYVSLYHAHIPKLENTGAVHFDEESETLSPGTHADTMCEVLDVVSNHLDHHEEVQRVDRNAEST
ncbi:DUF7344 domain-containing protein [Halocatena marina]|uniref:DUF7344 domain-containing protein n=1 Tax=Halocatena marina TaxID=2934937 RepID=A0ABD5YNM3_9EURY|nr:hypothetical protein [Halocatena marina]